MIYELISAKTCPYVQRVVILLEEKGIEYTHTTIDLNDSPVWFIELSPLGRVPLLKLPNGTVLFESQVINEYLDEVEIPVLHSLNNITKAENRAWIELISNIMVSFGGYYYATDQETMDEHLQTVKERLATLEAVLGEGPFFNGEQFYLIDAAAAPLFSRIELLNGFHEINLLGSYSKVTAWSNALLARPSVKAVATDEFQQDVISALRQQKGQIAQFITA